MKPAKKQTAGNNITLRRVKKEMNTKIFKKMSKLINEGNEQEAVRFILSFFREEFHEKQLAFFFPHIAKQEREIRPAFLDN